MFYERKKKYIIEKLYLSMPHLQFKSVSDKQNQVFLKKKKMLPRINNKKSFRSQVIRQRL